LPNAILFTFFARANKDNLLRANWASKWEGRLEWTQLA